MKTPEEFAESVLGVIWDGLSRLPDSDRDRHIKAIKAAVEKLSPTVCPKCEGYGLVADTEDEEPWTEWENLPPGSDLAVEMGMVKPKPCSACSDGDR